MELYLGNLPIIVITVFFDHSTSSNVQQFVFVLSMFDNLLFRHILLFVPIEILEGNIQIFHFKNIGEF